MDLARHVAGWSKDRSTQVGCVIVGPRREIRSVGFNGFPRYVDDDVDSRHERPAKYFWTEHAERNAIYNAAAHGTPLYKCTMYIDWYPCADCARAIIQSGITRLVCIEPDWQHEKWGADFCMVTELLDEAGIEVDFHEEEK